MSEFAKRLEEAIGTRSIQQVADSWGVPYWVVRDLRRERVRVPRSPDHIVRIARGMGLEPEEFLTLAHRLEQEVSA